MILFPNYGQAFTVTDDLDSSPKLPAYPEIQTLAGKNSPDIRAAEATVQQQNFAITSARAAYLPTLSVDYFFGLQANQLAIHDPEGHNLLGSSVAAQLTIPIWNWGATKSKVKQAELELQQAKNDLSLTQRTLLSNMDSLLPGGPGGHFADRFAARFPDPFDGESAVDAAALHGRRIHRAGSGGRADHAGAGAQRL